MWLCFHWRTYIFMLIFGLGQKREDLSENTLSIFLTL